MLGGTAPWQRTQTPAITTKQVAHDLPDTESAADSCMRLARFRGCCRVGHTNRLLAKDIDEDMHTRVLSMHSRVALHRGQCAKSVAATCTLARGQMAVMTPATRSVATRRAAVSSGVGSRNRQNSAISAGWSMYPLNVVGSGEYQRTPLGMYVGARPMTHRNTHRPTGVSSAHAHV